MAPISRPTKASTSKKPYDKAPSTTGLSSVKDTKGKAVAPARGAPATLKQTSRKGKKAWRKNVDITAEEEALELAREEERVTGGKFSNKPDGQLFTIDTVGDVEVAQRLRKAHKPLRSLAILDERSAVPSLTSKPPSLASAKRTKISSRERERLRRMAKRATVDDNGKLLANTEILVPTKDGEGLLDPWATKSTPLEDIAPIAIGGFGVEGMYTPQPNVPITLKRQRDLYLKEQVTKGRGAELPETGISYNPTEESHKKLLELAVDEEISKLAQEEKDAEKSRLLGEVVVARKAAWDAHEEYAEGMKIGSGDEDSDAVDSNSDSESKETTKRNQPRRKTQAQRNKASKLKEIKRLNRLEETNRRLLHAISTVPSLKKNIESRLEKVEEERRLREIARREREKVGYEGGEKVGKYRVGKESVAVQLGEDLAESLRQVKPEGNLFKDRFLSLQKRALLEPRVPVLPKRRTTKTKEYEKHAWKRFV